jgi:hypothetical protein
MNYFKDETGAVYAYDSEQVAAGLADGKTPMTAEEVEAHKNPPKTTGRLIDEFKSAIQSHMDDAAKSAGYDDIKAAVTYADEPSVPKFQNEGRAFRAWRSLCWAYGYQEMDKVLGGTRPMPTVAELISELPVLELPA